MTQLEAIELPVPHQSRQAWGSDALAEMIRAVDLPYIALNPGASYRGLHDSLVNHLGNRAPQILLCLHEEHCVAIAHGYAKVTGRPMGVILHSNVGLMNGLMAIFNAWCDRVPMLVFGATGPVDAAKRRPWIDWVHTCRDQAALIRHFVKWDDQPASIDAAMEAVLRANLISRTRPTGPTYVNFDVSLQEQSLSKPAVIAGASGFEPVSVGAIADSDAQAIVKLLKDAASPVILVGRVSRDCGDWARRVALAEATGARVISDLKVGASFPTNHPLHAGPPGVFMSPEAETVLGEADVVLSLDWVDLAGDLKTSKNHKAKIIHISLDYQLHNGWGMEHQALARIDMRVGSDPDLATEALVRLMDVTVGSGPEDAPVAPRLKAPDPGQRLDIEVLSAALGQGLAAEKVCFVRLPIGWMGGSWDFRHPLDYLGHDGGAGIGSGPGMLVGAALALQGTQRLPVAVLGDGDFMMASSALWTAAHYRVPLLAIVSNNRSFYNDEVHQERVAVIRDRPIDNKWIGQRISDPDINLAEIARAQGLVGLGPVFTAGDLIAAVKEALPLVKAGRAVVIDARVEPGYGSNMVRGLTRAAEETTPPSD